MTPYVWAVHTKKALFFFLDSTSNDPTPVAGHRCPLFSFCGITSHPLSTRHFHIRVPPPPFMAESVKLRLEDTNEKVQSGYGNSYMIFYICNCIFYFFIFLNFKWSWQFVYDSW